MFDCQISYLSVISVSTQHLTTVLHSGWLEHSTVYTEGPGFDCQISYLSVISVSTQHLTTVLHSGWLEHSTI